MKKYWNATKKELITAFAAISIAYAVGLLPNVLGENPNYDEPFGSIFSLLTGVVIWIFAGSSAMRNRFTLTVSMSNTRSNYIRQELFCAVGGSLFLMSVWCLFFWAEYIILCYLHWKYIYTVFSADTNFLNVFPYFNAYYNYFSNGNFLNITEWGTVFLNCLSVFSMLIGCRMLLDSLLLRFGNIIFWISSLGFLIILSIDSVARTILIFICLEFSWLIFLLLGILFSLIGIRIMKRQEVLLTR